MAEELNYIAYDGQAGTKKTAAKTRISRTKIAKPNKTALRPKAASQAKKGGRGWMIAAFIGVLLLGGGLIFSQVFSPPSSPETPASPTTEAISQPTATEPALPEASPTVEAEPSPIPSPTPTPEPIGPPVLGGTDKIAFIAQGNVWMMNVDGNELEQLTTDSTEKRNLQWLADGVISVISDECQR